MTQSENRYAFRTALLLEKLAGATTVAAANDATYFFCGHVPKSAGAEEHFFFCTGKESHTTAVQPESLRSFWIARDGELIAVSAPHGAEQPQSFVYYRGAIGSERVGAGLLDPMLFEFVDAPNYSPPQIGNFSRSLVDSRTARRDRER